MSYKKKPNFAEIHSAMFNPTYISFGINSHSKGKSGRKRPSYKKVVVDKSNIEKQQKIKIRKRRLKKKLARKVSRR